VTTPLTFTDTWALLTTPTVLTEIGAFALALLVAWLAPKATPRTTIGSLATREARIAVLVTVLLGVVLPYGVPLLLVVAAKGLLTANALDLPLLEPAGELLAALLAALLAIRIGTFLLGLSFGHASRLSRWESRFAVVLWVFVALHLLGWLEASIGALDSIPLSGSDRHITLWSVIRSLFTVSAFVVVSVWVARQVEQRVHGLTDLAQSTRIGVTKFSTAMLIGLGGLLGLSASGLDLTALTVFSGAIGLGLGFGLQSIAANFVSGFVLLMDKSIKPGDVISFTGTLGTHTEGFGWVQELRGRYVVVRDRDGVETLVPNQNLITNQVINWSYSDKRVRLKLPVRVAYDCDPELALSTLLLAPKGIPRILADPAPVTRLMGFHDWGFELELRFWITDPQDGVNNVRSEVNRAIWRLFKERGLRIPVAQQEIRLVDAEGRVLGLGALRGEPPPAP
jgi:small-conductance mechanosensitive channel